MAICSMCMQSKECQPLFIGEEHRKVSENVCRGCRMSAEKVVNFITYCGYNVHLSMQPRLFDLTPAGEHDMLMREADAIPDPADDTASPPWMAASAETEGGLGESEGDRGEPSQNGHRGPSQRHRARSTPETRG